MVQGKPNHLCTSCRARLEIKHVFAAISPVQTVENEALIFDSASDNAQCPAPPTFALYGSYNHPGYTSGERAIALAACRGTSDLALRHDLAEVALCNSRQLDRLNFA
jgi:hypothetical protein